MAATDERALRLIVELFPYALVLVFLGAMLLTLSLGPRRERRYRQANPQPIGLRWGDGSWTSPGGRIVKDPDSDPEYQALRAAHWKRIFDKAQSRA